MRSISNELDQINDKMLTILITQRIIVLKIEYNMSNILFTQRIEGKNNKNSHSKRSVISLPSGGHI